MPEHPLLQFPGGLLVHGPNLLSGEFLHRRKPLTFRRIGNEHKRKDQADHPRHSRRQKAPLPTGRRHDKARHNHGQGFSQLRRSAENAIHSAPPRQREPARQADGSGRRAHALRPAVEPPQHHKQQHHRHRAHRQRAMQEPQRAQQQVHQGRYPNARRHKTPDVAIVRNEPVHEFAGGIDEKKGRSDNAQLPGREHPAVDERLLYHAERAPADVIERIDHRHAPERPAAQAFVHGIHLPFRHLLSPGLANAEEGEKGHYKSLNRADNLVPGTYTRACRPTLRAACTLVSLSSIKRISPAGKPIRATASS